MGVHARETSRPSLYMTLHRHPENWRRHSPCEYTSTKRAAAATQPQLDLPGSCRGMQANAARISISADQYPRGLTYLHLSFFAAQRLRCASAIRLRASGLSTRDLRDFAGDFLVLRSVAFEEPEPASRERTWVSRAISESIWARIESIAIVFEHNSVNSGLPRSSLENRKLSKVIREISPVFRHSVPYRLSAAHRMPSSSDPARK